ncbi:MAG: hypothetical protein DRO89_06340 [Candidatus Altiarchaeales archaeon]|nr:MAG: hypothetical protein DRO89_06340 [Candidatus Altiarchaeales archaeon]
MQALAMTPEHTPQIIETIRFESPEARRQWSPHIHTLINAQQKLKKAGIVSIMSVGVDKVIISISLTSVAKSIARSINVKGAQINVEVKDKALLIYLSK